MLGTSSELKRCLLVRGLIATTRAADGLEVCANVVCLRAMFSPVDPRSADPRGDARRLPTPRGVFVHQQRTVSKPIDEFRRITVGRSPVDRSKTTAATAKSRKTTAGRPVIF
jgi:hypothetical protein